MASRRHPVRDARLFQAPRDGLRDLHPRRDGRLSAAGRSRIAASFGAAALLGIAGGLAVAALAPGWDAPPLPDGTRYSLLAVGDSGHRAKFSPWVTPQLAVGDALWSTHRSHPADYLLLLGDNFYPAGLEQDEAEARIAMNLVAPLCGFLDLSAPLGANVEPSCGEAAHRRRPIPVRAVLGNHDYRTAESPALQRELVPRYLANFVLKEEVAWVEETAAGVSLVFFDSTPGRSPEGVEQLRAALAAARGPWRVVVSHHPIDASPKGDALRSAIDGAGVPVHLWLAGHDHNLQFSEPRAPGPALQVIAGAGSHPTGAKYDIPGRSFFKRSLGYARVDLVPDPAAPGREELVVSLVSVRPVPAALWQRARAVARYAVAQDGSVRRVFQEASDTADSGDLEDEPFE
jgi:hypothetical protein